MNDLIPETIAEDIFYFSAFVPSSLCRFPVGIVHQPAGEFGTVRPADPYAVSALEFPFNGEDAGGEEAPAVPGKDSAGALIDNELPLGRRV